MGKYIALIYDEPYTSEHVGENIYRMVNSTKTFTATELATLFTPYTEPDLDAIRKEEYNKGFQAGSANTSLVITDNTIREHIEEAYLQGLEDARNRKATCEFCEYAGNDESNEPCVRCCCGYMNMFRPKKEEIQIGDEVEFYNGDKCVVTVVENGQVLEVMGRDGYSMKMDVGLRNSMDKTGRHFNELGKLLQKMNEDDG